MKLEEKEIVFEARDGWKIGGTLSIPSDLQAGERVAGVVLVHSPAHDQDAYLGRHLVGRNREAQEPLRVALGRTATLRIDIRGRGTSASPTEFHEFTPELRSRLWMDVQGAVEFLRREEGIDPDRIGVVAEGTSAEPAIVAATSGSRVSALVILSGRVSDQVARLLAGRPDLSLLGVVSREDSVSVRETATAISWSPNPESDLLVLKDVGVGNSMFIMWANKNPEALSLESRVAGWLNTRLESTPVVREVTLKSKDGWDLFGSFRLPKGQLDQPAPGVILLHSYLTDRHVFDGIEQRLALAGMAVLNMDFRGRGKSIGKGKYFDLPIEERDNARLDVEAAADFLARQPCVDGNGLGIVATSIGVKYGLKSASRDARIKSFVMLGGMPDPEDVERAEFPILFVSSLGLPEIANAFREFYRMKKKTGSHLLEYEGGAIGYQLFDIDEGIESLIVRWIKPQLTLS